MTATVRFVLTKPHDVVLRARAVAVDDGSVQHEQTFEAGPSECMSDEFAVHAGVMLIVDEPIGAGAGQPLKPDGHAAAQSRALKQRGQK